MNEKGANETSLTSDLKIAINNYIAKILLAVGIANIVAIGAGVAYALFVLPKEAVDLAYSRMQENITLTDQRIAEIHQSLFEKVGRIQERTEEITRRLDYSKKNISNIDNKSEKVLDEIAALEAAMNELSEDKVAKASKLVHEFSQYTDSQHLLDEIQEVKSKYQEYINVQAIHVTNGRSAGEVEARLIGELSSIRRNSLSGQFRDFSWNGRMKSVQMVRLDEGICSIVGISGDHGKNRNKIEIVSKEGFWWLDGDTEEPNTSVKVRCFNFHSQ